MLVDDEASAIQANVAASVTARTSPAWAPPGA